MSIKITEKAAIAARFVNSTNSHIFLTGKAGTGKTTFLHELSASTYKRHVILAPTGIAALNANGVTIHSQFLFPLGSFLPGRDLPQNIPEGPNYYTEHSLARKHPLNAKRREVLRNIDLIIIDEVSMLRADLLDAIDYRMRSLKRNYRQRFGGVQLLMIGDLYQLAPIVKNPEWSVLKDYYQSPYFFDAQSLQEEGFVYIELDKIYRQQNTAFINILNNLRNNILTPDNLQELNKHYRPQGEAGEGVITITTHNYQADELNQKALNRLEGRPHYFTASVQGDFPERIFPVAERLELKVGAQIMFIKNDTQEGIYFNGKLAKVTSIEGGDIEVTFTDNANKYLLRQESWENKKYSINETTKEMEDEVTGTFMQYPVKLAWAITVHKSQGLTFDKAIINVGKAFAPGQVYVALSRLTSLDGLVLRTPVNPNLVSSDHQVVEFSKKYNIQEKLPKILQYQQAVFLENLLQSTFSFKPIINQLNLIQEKHDTTAFEDDEMRTVLEKLNNALRTEQQNTLKFSDQLGHLLSNKSYSLLVERISKGSNYFKKILFTCLEELLIHYAEVGQFTRTKSYLSALSELDLMMMKKLEELDHAAYIVASIISGEDIERQAETDESRQLVRKDILEKVEQHIRDHPKNSVLKSGRKRSKKGLKKVIGATYLETYKLVNEGLGIDQIARQRGLKKSTIETHYARGLSEGKLKIEQVMNMESLHKIQSVIEGNKYESVTEIYQQLKGKFSYGQLRMVMAYQFRDQSK